MKFQLLQITLTVALITSACQSQKENTEHNHDSTAASQTVAQDTIKKSIPKEEHAQVGSAHLMLKYHAPAVRGRTIWGGLIPYGDVWVTGAHSATTFEFDKALVIGEKEIAPGKVALFTIPNKDNGSSLSILTGISTLPMNMIRKTILFGSKSLPNN